jgi:hypothetical protein
VGTAQTKAKNAKLDAKPRQDWTEITQLGLTAQALAKKYATDIGTRLPATFLTTYAADLASLPAAVPNVITTKSGAVQLTAAQTTALDQGYQLGKGIKLTVKSYSPDKGVLLAYGIGAHVNKLVVKDVVASLTTILNRVTAEPAEATSFDITSDDVNALKAAIAAIQTADSTQEQGRASAPQATKDRNATARRILAGVKKIAGAGMRAFVGQDTVYSAFEALVTKTAAS